MGIRYDNLDAETRHLMIEEILVGPHYNSPRLTDDGTREWVGLLQEAASYDDDWLSEEIQHRRYLRGRESYIRNGKSFFREINAPHAAQMLAEGEFNRFYLRALCRRAIQNGSSVLVIYRGKDVQRPRPESEARIGTTVDATTLLNVLRTSDFVSIEDGFGVPGGPNSGLTARLG